MNIGDTFKSTVTVMPANTAKTMGSGDLDVFATPSMIALMENAASCLIVNSLEEGQTSVGIFIESQHVKASKIGAEISAIAKITEIDGRIITFTLEAYDGEDLIGKGSHKRAIVNTEKFLSRL